MRNLLLASVDQLESGVLNDHAAVRFGAYLKAQRESDVMCKCLATGTKAKEMNRIGIP